MSTSPRGARVFFSVPLGRFQKQEVSRTINLTASYFYENDKIDLVKISPCMGMHTAKAEYFFQDYSYVR